MARLRVERPYPPQELSAHDQATPERGAQCEATIQHQPDMPQNFGEDEGMSNSWEKPNTNRARNQILEYQLIGTRRLANTLLLTVLGTNEGPDPKPTIMSRQTLLLQAKTTR